MSDIETDSRLPYEEGPFKKEMTQQEGVKFAADVFIQSTILVLNDLYLGKHYPDIPTAKFLAANVANFTDLVIKYRDHPEDFIVDAFNMKNPWHVGYTLVNPLDSDSFALTQGRIDVDIHAPKLTKTGEELEDEFADITIDMGPFSDPFVIKFLPFYDDQEKRLSQELDMKQKGFSMIRNPVTMVGDRKYLPYLRTNSATSIVEESMDEALAVTAFETLRTALQLDSSGENVLSAVSHKRNRKEVLKFTTYLANNLDIDMVTKTSDVFGDISYGAEKKKNGLFGTYAHHVYSYAPNPSDPSNLNSSVVFHGFFEHRRITINVTEGVDVSTLSFTQMEDALEEQHHILLVRRLKDEETQEQVPILFPDEIFNGIYRPGAVKLEENQQDILIRFFSSHDEQTLDVEAKDGLQRTRIHRIKRVNVENPVFDFFEIEILK